jgi:hypothetical protein
MECHHWLTVEINPEEDRSEVSRRASGIKQRKNRDASADLQLAYSA